MKETAPVVVEFPIYGDHSFIEYIKHCKNGVELRKNKNRYIIKLCCGTLQDQSAFLALIKKLYNAKKVNEMKEKIPCQATCRDGTHCLNKTMQDSYCCKHRQQVRES